MNEEIKIVSYRPGVEENTRAQLRLLFKAVLVIEGLMIELIYNLPDKKAQNDALEKFKQLASITQEFLDLNTKKD